MMEEEEEEPEDDEDYEIGEDDLEDLGNDMNLMLNTYNDQTTLRNTKLNMKQGLLNKKKMRNLKNERKNEINNNNKNKKKKIEEPHKEFNKNDKTILRIISEEDSTISWKEILQNLKD